MATLANAKTPDRRVPQRVGMLSTLFANISPSMAGLSVGTISIGDRIDVAKLPKKFRITEAALRVTGTLLMSGTPTVQLVQIVDGTSYPLTAAILASEASNAVMSIAPLARSITISSESMIAISVAGGTLSRTISTQFMEVMAQYESDDA